MTGPPLSFSIGLHRRRAGRRCSPGWRRPPCSSATPGGRRWCWRARGCPPTGCSRRAASGRTATPPRSRPPSATRTTPTAGRRPARGQGAAALRPRGVDHRPLPRPSPAAPHAAVRGDPAARALGAGQPAARRRRQRRRLLRPWRARSNAGRLDLGGVTVYAFAAIGTSAIAFGGLNWALDGAAAPVAAVRRLESAMAPAGALRAGSRRRRRACPAAACASATSRSPTRAGRSTGARGLRPRDPRRHVAGDRRRQRRRQDHAGQAAVPPLRPAVRRDRGRRRRPARPRRRRPGAAASPRSSRTSSASS